MTTDLKPTAKSATSNTAPATAAGTRRRRIAEPMSSRFQFITGPNTEMISSGTARGAKTRA